MAQPIGNGERVEDARFRAPSTSSDESSFSLYNPPLRANVNRLSAQTPVTGDTRALLPRRFTTQGVATLSSLLPIGQLRRQPTEPQSQDMPFSIVRQAQLLEKRQAECDFLKQKALQFQHEMDRITNQVQREEEEVHRLRNDLGSFHQGAGHQSEPTTPPEYIGHGFPTSLSRPNRFSASGIISPPGLTNRPSRAGSQVTSPPVERARAYQALTSGAPSQSVPGSRRDSDEDEDDYNPAAMSFNTRGAASRNRNSMPVTRRDHVIRNNNVDFEHSPDQVDTSGYLFREDSNADESSSSSRPVSAYHSTTVDRFPVPLRGLVDQQESSVPLSQDQNSDQGGWPTSFVRPNTSHGALPMTQTSTHSTGDSQQTSVNRHSMEPRINFTETMLPTPTNGTSNVTLSHRMPTRLQTSFSTSSVPTVGSLAGSNGTSMRSQALPISGGGHNNITSGSQAQSLITADQRFLNHTISLGRIPSGAINSNRQSRDVSGASAGDMPQSEGQPSNMHAHQSGLQPNAPSFGPSGSTHNSSMTGLTNNAMVSYANQGNGMGYNMQNNSVTLSDAMRGLSIDKSSLTSNQPTSSPWSGPIQGFQQAFIPGYQQGFPGFASSQSYNNNNRIADNQSRAIQPRRRSDENARFASIDLQGLVGQIHSLCKDQHGCRFLQRKLEDGNLDHVQMIFVETHQHMVDLMTDPFGNYLVQKLLEYTNTMQRTILINNAATHMVNIAINSHGTRALQKMIEYVSTPEQVQTVIYALRYHVVTMIQDINGNHVIQKCLNRLSSADAQFIFDAVAGNIMAVGSHKHGCCVIQRCIDHASEAQKVQLFDAITLCALPLVQDPFGNYVAQYVLDQRDVSKAQPLCRMFLGQIAALSKQKFSSNAMEKCIRVSEPDIRHCIILELLPDFERLTEDAFGNYVIQTAFEFASDADKASIADRLRPALAQMRNRPYARKLQGKLNDYDKELERRMLEDRLTFARISNVYADSGSFTSHGRQSTDSGSGPSPPGTQVGSNIVTPSTMMPYQGHSQGYAESQVGFNNIAPTNMGSYQVQGHGHAVSQYPANGQFTQYQHSVNGQSTQHQQSDNGQFAQYQVHGQVPTDPQYLASDQSSLNGQPTQYPVHAQIPTDSQYAVSRQSSGSGQSTQYQAHGQGRADSQYPVTGQSTQYQAHGQGRADSQYPVNGQSTQYQAHGQGRAGSQYPVNRQSPVNGQSTQYQANGHGRTDSQYPANGQRTQHPGPGFF